MPDTQAKDVERARPKKVLHDEPPEADPAIDVDAGETRPREVQ